VQTMSGARPRIFQDGSQARDQVYVDDVVDCTIAAAGLGPGPRPQPGVYNLGSGVATTFNQVVDSVRAGLGLNERDRPTDYFPMPPEIRRFYQDYTCADMSRAAEGLSWRPRWRPTEAMAKYVRFLAAQHQGGPCGS
jgi:ADP-L-glycero-D-manno-heptose 6-epimerase